MNHNLFALSLGFVGLILATEHAYGQEAQQCGPRPDILAHLSEAYGETRRGLGLTANRAVVEVFASDQTGSWTITVTLPNGTTCLIASGENYEPQPAQDMPEGSPA